MGIGQAHTGEPENELRGQGHPDVSRGGRLPPVEPGPAHRSNEPLGFLGIGGDQARPPSQSLLVELAQLGAPRGEEGRLVPVGTDEQGNVRASVALIQPSSTTTRTMSAAGTRVSASLVSGTPSAEAMASALEMASSGGATCGGPLWMMALWNRPFAAGTASRVPILIPPADSPNRVTLSGSPPKAAMLSRTQVRAAT